jgi:hypothetical protein
MSARDKSNQDDDNFEEFFMYSWTKEEYLSAIKVTEFYDSIKNNLDSGPEDSEDPVDKVESKHYFSGGCARFMFRYPTAKVKSFLKDSMDAVSDIGPYLQGKIGDRSVNVINRLFSLYNGRTGPETWVVSRFVSVSYALKRGPGVIKELARAVEGYSNPAMDGWMMEMQFFAHLNVDGIVLSDSTGTQKKEFPKSPVQIFDVKALLSVSFPDDSGIWLKPQQWNQGGYDAVYVHKKDQRICFVQVTLADSHSLKLRYFRKFTNMLMQMKDSKGFEVKTLEIVFIVGKGKIDSLKISPVTGKGALAAFGWIHSKEAERVERLELTSFVAGRDW